MSKIRNIEARKVPKRSGPYRKNMDRNNRYKLEAKKKALRNNKNKQWANRIIILCLMIGICIGWYTEFSVKDFVNTISKYKIVIIKKEDK